MTECYGPNLAFNKAPVTLTGLGVLEAPIPPHSEKGFQMNKIYLAIAVLLLSACDSNVEGTYSDKMGITSYTFDSGDKVLMSTMGTEVEMNYEVDGDKVKLATPQGNLVLTLLEDGSIKGPMGMKLTKQKK